MQTELNGTSRISDVPRWVIDGIVRARIADVWPVAWPMLRPAVERASPESRFQERELLDLLLRGESQLWMILDAEAVEIAAFIVTSIIHDERFTSQKALEVPFIAGEGMKHWIDALYTLLSRFALAHDCTVMLGYGRKGWQRSAGFRAVGKNKYGTLIMARNLTEVN